VDKKKILRAIRANKDKAESILNACFVGGSVRAMTADEEKSYNDTIEENRKLRQLLERSEDLDEEGGEEEDNDPEVDDEEKPEARSRRVSESDQFRRSPAVHTRKHNYSLLRAWRSAADGVRVDGLEGEISQEIRRNAPPGKKHKGAFSMPIDPSPELRRLMYPNVERRDLTTVTGAGAIFNVPFLPLIDLLRPRMVLAKAGATFITGLQGLFSIPRQNGKSTVNWIGQSNAPTSAAPSNATLDQVPFSPNVAVDLTNISREFINQTSISAETFAMNDLARTMAVEWDRVGFNGLGSAYNQPTGVFQNSTIQSNSSGLAVGANGGPLAWANVVNMETQVANYNADMGSLCYITHPALRGTLKTTPKVGGSSAFPIYIWEDGQEPGVGLVNGYPAYSTSNLLSNITKGTGENLSQIVFGNFSDLIMASWNDGVDFLINPYSGQASASVAISMEMSVDAEVRHPESFSVIQDAAYNAF
jgi:HK97 family phage major capsid protein